MSKKKYDTGEPILVIVRRGRKGRGFTIAPVEDASNPAMCGTTEELGEVLEEMLNDEEQPRVNLNDLLAEAAPERAAPDDEADEEEDDDSEWAGEQDEEEEEGEGGIFDGVAGSADPADTLLFNIFSRVVKGGQNISSKPRAPRSRTRRRRPSGKKNR
jgi:hypothetical protein